MMVGEKRLMNALDKYAEAAKEYADAKIRRVKFEEALELEYYDRYLKGRESGEKKPSETEAKARAKLQLEDKYKELARLRATEIMAEAVMDVRKKQLAVYMEIYRNRGGEE